ncbi:MAG TPA: AAA family ATPase [Lacipirellulaceae bacterium]|nr:AAA family ATPase [Lacipirellulaceae bacterium]
MPGESAISDTLPFVPQAKGGTPNDLEALLERIHQLAGNETAGAAAPAPAEPRKSTIPAAAAKPAVDPRTPRSAPGLPAADERDEEWRPLEPLTLRDAGLTEGQLEHLALKCLGACGDMSGRDLSEQHAVPFRLLEPVLQGMKLAQLVAFRGSAAMNDFVYQLTDVGRERAKKLSEACSYFGAAPVPLSAYCASVAQQSLTKRHPTQRDLERAFADLLINKHMLRRLGPAINSGRGLFLYGQPGNGKTSIAERVTAAFGDCIWAPRSIVVDGEIMRVFDPSLHHEAPLNEPTGPLQTRPIDRRWVRIRRPTIVVGGELTMDSLEVNASAGINVSEAPLQMKSNCGTLVIDDFGRQRMTTDELLNRWIVPLEKRYDYLQMNNGKKIQVPFDQLIIFSTNLEPKDLVDDAFLRRIPYKIEVLDPSEEEFRELFKVMAPKLGIKFEASALDYLIDKHYRSVNRPFRCCQPRDLLLQVVNYCRYLGLQPEMTSEYFDCAVENYFAIM